MIQSRLITGIMACDEQGMIGKGRGADAGLPWNCPDDMAHFRRTTRDQIMIMGQATYDCLPATLRRNRICIVLSHHADHVTTEKLFFVDDIDKVPELLAMLPQNKKIYMIGGANVALQFFQRNILDRFLLSEIPGTYDGDCAFAPEFLHGLKRWTVKTSEQRAGFVLKSYINPQADNLC